MAEISKQNKKGGGDGEGERNEMKITKTSNDIKKNVKKNRDGKKYKIMRKKL